MGIYDIGQENLIWAMEKSEFPVILQTLVGLSRKTFGFFTKTISRSFEYPFIVGRIGELQDKSLLDIGAGLSPLPILLAMKGANVVTIDNSSNIRNLEQNNEAWNEWGFFDYGSLHTNITSINNDILTANFPNESFDGIYSVSVIEHIPAVDRGKIWLRLMPWLKTSGKLLLTVDLIPETDLLWNFCAGQIVEESEQHGDLGSVLNELTIAGFKLRDISYLRMLPQSKTDVALLEFNRI